MFGKIENKFDFRKRLTLKEVLNNTSDLVIKDDEISLTGGVEIVGELGSSARFAVEDINVFLSSVTKKDGKKVKIEIIKDDKLLGEFAVYKGRKITVTDKIVINAYDDRGVSAAIYDIEKALATRRAPYIKKGEYFNKPLFSPRIVHSGYGLEEYPEEYMINLVKEGIDAIAVFVKDKNTTQLGYLDFNALIDKANAIGLDVYAYCMLNGFNHPDEPNAEEIFDGVYGDFFRAHNGFKGLILVGESVEFPSKDPRVLPRHYYDVGTPDNIPDGNPSPGWWPCCDYPQWVALVAKSVRKAKPDADIVFWTYNWATAPEKDRISLINNLPTDVTLLVTLEVSAKYAYGKVNQMVMDYSIAYPNVSECFLSEAKAAKARGLKLYTMCNSGGRTWDMGVVPLIPSVSLWKERFECLLDCEKKYGLSGLMECHHYGYTFSYISRFADYCFCENGMSVDESFNRAMRDYFGENATAVSKALQIFSEAMRLCPPTVEMQYGPMRISTAYPLILLRKLRPVERENVSFGLDICYLEEVVADTCKFLPQSVRYKEEISGLAMMKEKTEKAITVLSGLENKNDNLYRLINTLEFIVCTVETARNTLLFNVWKKRLFLASSVKKVKKAVREIKEIANREIFNAKKSIEFVEKDSALGYEPSMGYACDRERIEWKIKQVKYMLEKELSLYDI